MVFWHFCGFISENLTISSFFFIKDLTLLFYCCTFALEMKNTGQLILAFLVVILGIGLLYVGLMTPPEGEIDASLLVAYGETLTFAGAIIGIDYRYKNAKPAKQPEGRAKPAK